MSGRVETPVCMKNIPDIAFKWKFKARKSLIFAFSHRLTSSHNIMYKQAVFNRNNRKLLPLYR
jgi:hypothetical protein